MRISKAVVKKCQVKTWPHKDDDDAHVHSTQIDRPILAFWLTYFGIMFAILCGLIAG
jgi:hypothetical protein